MLTRFTIVRMLVFAVVVLGGVARIPGCEAELLAQSQAVDELGPQIVEIQVRGNAKVESDAILTLLKTRAGDRLSPGFVKEDIKVLFELGYFSDVRFFKNSVPGGINVIIQVAEKPAIVGIKFEGLSEITEDTVKEKLETKLYTIVNEATITADVRMIEKQYTEKGFYLARVHYNLEKKSATEVELTYVVEEGGKLKVGNVDILGNAYFSDGDIVDKLACRPYTRGSAYGSASLFQDDLLRRDVEFMSYYYRDNGFAEVKVGKPNTLLDTDREFVQLTFLVEEGLQYNVGTIDVSGDLLFTKEELFEAMKLKPGELFRYSRFTRDIEMLGDKYGDLGYAYADVNPRTTFNREKRTVDINYEITKGDKVYFGTMTILGNTKTRDNVVRRELEVADSELYSGTRLSESKKNINRLGFFEEVQVLRERDEGDSTLLNLKFKVKEKPTGQLQAALGFSPGGGGTESTWFGQGRYDEQNQSGRSWKTNLTGKWDGKNNYSLEAGFSDPRVNDSKWLAGTSAYYKNEVGGPFEDVSVETKRLGGTVFVGRRIIELISARVTYKLERIIQSSEAYLLDRFRENGLSSSAIFSLSRVATNNYMDPNEGSEVDLRQQITGGPILRGDQQFMESMADASYYLPFDFSDTYRTYFKFHGLVSYIYPNGDKEVPYMERYRLGGPLDLRGYRSWDIGPRIGLLRAPGDAPQLSNKGGDKKLLFQAEYFVPLIPEAGIKALLFSDIGRVYDDAEALAFKGFYKDVGFGFRWITPLAPFRFEWAYPVLEGGKLGNMEIVFYIGY